MQLWSNLRQLTGLSRRSLDGFGDHLAHFAVVSAVNNGLSIVSVQGSNPMNACPKPGLGISTFVITVSHVTTSASQGHFSTCTPPLNPMEFRMLLCALWGVVGVVPTLRFGPTWRVGPSSVRHPPCCHRRNSVG